MGEGKLSPRKQRITKESSNQQHTKYLIDYLDKKRSDVLYRLPEPPQKLKFLDIMNDISPYFTVNTPQPPSAITASSPRDDPHSDQSQPGSGKKIWKRVIVSNTLHYTTLHYTTTLSRTRKLTSYTRQRYQDR